MLNYKTTFITLFAFALFSISCSKPEPVSERTACGATLSPEVGGPNQPNQVYVNLYPNESTLIKRDSWDLRFYSGENFRVGINGSIYMAAKALDFTDIDAVSEVDVMALYDEIAIGTFDPINVNYVDDFDGVIENTAIAEISAIPDENKVYLVNLGYSVGIDTPDPGSVAVTGTHRDWKKIRILKSGENYLLQYANLNDTTHQEIIISKDADYNFTFFSFNTEEIVSVEPPKNQWDLNFTVFSNEISGYGTYGYTDFITTNNLQNVQAYIVNESDTSFDLFTLSDIVEDDFSNSQRAIGSNWRVGGGPGDPPSVIEAIFFVLKDTEGQFYKIKFMALMNTYGVRGYPQFQYELL